MSETGKYKTMKPFLKLKEQIQMEGEGNIGK
jgi:hypothetical protein